MTDEPGLKATKDKVRKLLALSKSDNENEAAAVLEKANALIDKHDLCDGDLRFESVYVKATKTPVIWRTAVANAVTWLYCCHSYLDQDTGLRVFTGEALDAFLASEMYSFLVYTVERCAKHSIRKNAKFNFRRDFKLGMANRLHDRIMELGEACSWAPHRQIKIEEAREYVKGNVNLESYKFNKAKRNSTAFGRGMLHGDGVSLARQAGHTPTPQIAGSHGATIQKELF
jgi:hypothetical protein